MFWRNLIVAAALGSAPVAVAVAAAPAQSLHAVVYVDLIPTDEAAGSTLLAGYVGRARRDPALMSVTLIRQASIPNHFILDESFPSPAAYQRFTQQAYVRDFRAALYPHLGSPWDERVGTDVSA